MDAAAAEEIARLKDVVADARERISDLGGSTSKVSDKLGATAGALGKFTGEMNSGAQGMSAYNGLVLTVSGGLSNLAKNADGTATSLSVLAGASGSLITAIFKQSDALFKSYQDISQIGAAGSSGMQGVFDSMQQFGYSINELPKFGALLTQNAEALALFGGTVAQGTKQFANVSEGIQRSGLQTEFERMGMSVDSINKGTAAYLKIQTATGASANKTQAELTAGAAEYIRQQDILTKLTGKSAETLAKAEEARQADERYRATQIELEMKAAAAEQAGDAASAAAFRDQITQNRLVLDTLPKELQAGAKDLQAGFANSPEAKKFLVSMPEMAQKLMSQNYKASEVLTAGQKEADRLTRANTGLARAGAFNKNFVDYGAAANFAAQGRVQTPAESREKAEAERKAMAEKPEAAVANQVAIRQSQQEITRSMNSLVQIGVHAATAAMQQVTRGIEAGVSRIPGTGDKTGIRNTPGRGDRSDTGFRGKVIAPEVIKQNQQQIDMFNKPGDALLGMIDGMAKFNNPASLITNAAKRPVNNSSIASIIDRTNLGNNQYTGPNSTLSAPVGDTTPTKPEATPASTTNNINPDMLTTSMNELIKRATLQQNSLDELVDLSRKSLAQGGKLVQAARQ